MRTSAIALFILSASLSLPALAAPKLSLGQIALQAARLPASSLEAREGGNGGRALIGGHYVFVETLASGDRKVRILRAQGSSRQQPEQSEYLVKAGAMKPSFVRAVTSSAYAPGAVSTMRFITEGSRFRLPGSGRGQTVATSSWHVAGPRLQKDFEHAETASVATGPRAPGMQMLRSRAQAGYQVSPAGRTAR